MRTDAITRRREHSSRIAMLAIGGVALVSAGLALAVHLGGTALGIAEEHARIAATAFLAAATLDLVALLLWERVYKTNTV
jgi:hypothetical protein